MTEKPESLLASPVEQDFGAIPAALSDPGDALSEVLASAGLRSRLFCRSELSAPWAMAIPPGDYAHFHYFESGGGWLHLEGQPEAIAVSSGELLVLPRGRGHSLSDTPGRPAVPLRYLLAGSQADGRCSLLRHGGGGPETRMICGSFSFAVPDGLPLLALLPELLRLRGDGASRGWLEPTLRMLADEARRRRAGGTIVTSRLTDVLFVQVVRAWLEAQPAPAGNWLAALRDPRIGAALARIHGRPEHPWSVAELAAEVGMSRSPFAYRFAALAGEPPLAYLARWRAQVAARLLRETSLALGAVAARVGYESEAAFSRAFRRAMGVAPGAYRRARRAA